jgi:MFS superfamily sulfate permease-like transporter
LAGLPAINGLYVSFFNVIVYSLLGTSKHLSTGTYAVISLIIASSIRNYEGVLFPKTGEASVISSNNSDFNSSSTAAITTTIQNSNYVSNDPVEGAIIVAAALAFNVGLIHILFAVLHVGFVTKYLSDSIVGGFTCASALHVITSQIGTLLGLKLEKINSTFALAGVNVNHN